MAWQFLNSPWWAFDRLVTAFVLLGLVLLSFYGALPGIRQELATRGESAAAWNMAGFPHELALGTGSWILLGLLLLAMLASVWEQRRAAYVLGALLALYALCPLLAGRWEAQVANASALRWLLAFFLVLASMPLWFRARLLVQLKSFGWPDLEHEELARGMRLALLLLTVAPLLALTAYTALKSINYHPVHGPTSGFFYRTGETLSYSVPLLVAALALIGHAVRERSAGFAFAAGLLFNLAVTMAQLLAVVAVGGSMNRVVLVQVIQLNAITSACYALAWLGTRDWWMRGPTRAEEARTESLLKIQVCIGLISNVLLIGPAFIKLFVHPTWNGIGTYEVGSLRGWLALVLSALAALCWGRVFRRRLSAGALCAALLCVGSLVAFDMARADAGGWTGYHALLCSLSAAAWLMMLAGWLPEYLARQENGGGAQAGWRKIRTYLAEDWNWDTVLLASASGALSVMLALRATWDDTQRPWWTVGSLVAMSGLAAGLNWRTLRRLFLYAAGILFNLAASIYWTTEYWSSQTAPFTRLVEVNVIALSLPGIAWLLLELRARRLAGVQLEHDKNAAFHHVAAICSLVAMILIAVGVFQPDAKQWALQPGAWTSWAALISVTALMTACLWDRQASYAVFGLYLLGLVAMALGLGQLDLAARSLAWTSMTAIAVYALLTSALWRSRSTLLTQAERLGIPRSVDEAAGLSWLRPANALLVAALTCVAYWIVLSFFEAPVRMLAALAVGTQVLTFGMLAEGARRSSWQRVALASLVLGAVFFGWAWLEPWTSGTWLNRAVLLMIVLLAMIAVYGASANKLAARWADWTSAARACVPWMAGAGLFALVFVLGTEVSYQVRFGAVRINPLALLTVAATLLSTSVMCIVSAVSPARDPLKLSERGRMKYIYVAEVMLALLFMHIRLTMPWLFTGFFERYWPLVIVLIAYLGVAISEALRRQGLMVVAEPVERTGVFLPLLPVLGFWMLDSQVDYSTVLFMIGMLYGGLSVLRRSFGFGLLAALCGNGALWYMLHRTESYTFFQHPQLWLIPVALSVLVAAYLNEDRFSSDQMASIRYITLMIVYVSSTSDIFLNGVAQSPWLPLVLAGLAITGVLGGIILRVRAFLFLGSTFLFIAVITMIWYASVNLGWTWLWYVAGIATGALIIFTFALFEKKRGELLRVVEDLRAWER